MKYAQYAVTLAFALISSAALAQPERHLMPALADAPSKIKIKIEYTDPTNGELKGVQQRLKNRYVLETLREFLSALRLPRELTVRTAQCSPNANEIVTSLEYEPQRPVTICYELIDKIEKITVAHTRNEDLQRKVVVGAFVQAALHETAYGIFDILEIPVWGRDFDAADRLAAFIIMQFGDDVANYVMGGTINLFYWSDKTWQGSEFASRASPDPQRFYNYACIAAAASPWLFSSYVKDKVIPADRAGPDGAWCDGEYAQVRKAFNLRLMPNVDADRLVKMRSTPWLAWTPAK